ncbi:MAG: class I SAM-dependent methyltransferase [Candidatus Binatia bacterium]
MIGVMPPAATQSSYVPALGLDWLTRFYDPLLRATLREDAFKRHLIAQAHIEPGHAVLDLGCGTGTLAILVKQACPQAIVVGLDGDPQVLAIARTKVATAGVDVVICEGMAFAPPFPAASFDRVLSTLVLHHLTTAEKRTALRAVRTLLRPGGELHVADWGPPQNALMWLASRGVQLLDGADRTEANLAGRLPTLLADAGFADVAETERWMTVFGTLAFYRGAVPA